MEAVTKFKFMPTANLYYREKTVLLAYMEKTFAATNVPRFRPNHLDRFRPNLLPVFRAENRIYFTLFEHTPSVGSYLRRIPKPSCGPSWNVQGYHRISVQQIDIPTTYIYLQLFISSWRKNESEWTQASAAAWEHIQDFERVWFTHKRK